MTEKSMRETIDGLSAIMEDSESRKQRKLKYEEMGEQIGSAIGAVGLTGADAAYVAGMLASTGYPWNHIQVMGVASIGLATTLGFFIGGGIGKAVGSAASVPQNTIDYVKEVASKRKASA